MPNPIEDDVLERLNESAQLEYGLDFVAATNTPDEILTVRRIARLTGIEMKRAFAEALPLNGPSETGAKRQWRLDGVFEALASPDDQAFDGLKNDASYKLTASVYKELQDQGDAVTQGKDFGAFLRDNHSESNWLLAALRASQPYICGSGGRAGKPTSAEQRSEFWEEAKGAAGEIAADLTSDGVKEAITPVSAALCTMVPFLSGANPYFVFGFTFLLVHFAKRGFCATEIQDEIINTLMWNQQ